jgi:DNA-binding NarL/FixJ family response regulator
VRKSPTVAPAPVPRPIQILLADDHAVVRAGLRALIDPEPNLHVIGEAATGEEAVAKTRALKPDVVVMDLLMPGMGGVEAIRRIARESRHTRVVVLTAHPEEASLLQVLEAGVRGYVDKTSAYEELTRAIRSVVQGEVFLDPGAMKLLVRHHRQAHSHETGGVLARLSAREREVLALTAEGHTATEIGRQLHLSPKTVETYRARVMEKLDLKHRSELVRWALRAGLLKSE